MAFKKKQWANGRVTLTRTRMPTVTVLSSYTVIPSEPTPTGIFSLSDFDQIRLSSHAPLLYVYKPHPIIMRPSCYSLTLRKSLSRALVHFYPFAGRLCEIQGGRWELHCNAMGAQLLEASCEARLDDLGDFVPTLNVERLMPKIDYGFPIPNIPLLVVQLTRFRCGGLTLGVAVSRAVVDGLATMVFVNSWAKLARGEDLDSTEIIFRDPTALNSRKLCMASRFDHSEFSPPPLWEGDLVDTKDEAIAAILKLTKDQVQKLKKKASDFGSGTTAAAPQRPYTSFEVIGGLLWRCVCKARYAGNGDQPTRFSTLVNCRRRLSPPLPNAYFGNATIPTVTKSCTFDDVIGKPLSYVVGNIRQALEKLSDEYIRSALDYIADQKDMSLVRNILYHSAASVGGQFRGNPNLNLVSWMNFPVEEADFGWGKPAYMGPGNINSEGKAFIMNNGDGDCFIVAIRLQASHMDAFKKMFYEEAGEAFPTSKL